MDFGTFTMVATRVMIHPRRQEQYQGSNLAPANWFEAPRGGVLFCVFAQKLREDESQKREQNPNLFAF
jgi:hypothetical protein